MKQQKYPLLIEDENMEQEFKVLVAEDDEILSCLYEMLLKSEITNSVYLAKDGSMAAKLLSEETGINLVISDFDMPYKNGDSLYLQDIKNKNIPTLLITGRTRYEIPHLNEFESDSKLNQYLQKPADIPKLLECLTSYKNEYRLKLNKTKEYQHTNFEKYLRINDFTCIPIKTLQKYGEHSIDVYIKLHQDKLTKIIAKANAQTLDKKMLQDYESKGFLELYLKKEDFLSISNTMIEQIKSNARDKNKITPTELAGLQLNISFKNLEQFGISEDQISTVNTILEDTLHTAFSDKNIEVKVKSLMKNYSYHTSHSVLLMYVASNIIKKTNLPYQPTLKKISLAAFFHDLSLDAQAVDSELIEMNPKKEGLSNLEKRLIEHPRQSALLLKKIKTDTFNEVEKIIEEHHENPNGTGYPRGLNANQIGVLSALFILSHEITNNLYRHNYNKEMLSLMLKNAAKDYSQGNYKNFYEAAKLAFLI